MPPQNKLHPDTLPATFGVYDSDPGASDLWWEDFGNHELNQLITTALTSNWNLESARQRLAAVRAQTRISTAQQRPTLDGRTTLDIGRRRNKGRPTTGLEELGIRLSAGYEVDLWGRVHADIKDAQLQAEAQDQAMQTAAMTLAAEITNRWIDIIAQKQERKLLDQQREVSRTLLDLIELRFQKSMASALDVYQQRRSVAQVEALIPLTEMREQTLRHGLSTLMGRPAASRFDIGTDQFPELTKIPGAGLPADLLKKRPDIRRAGFQLRASEWRIAEARANRLPRLQLSAVAGLTDLNLARLLDSWLVTLGGLLAGPVFDGGRRAAAVEVAHSDTQRYLADYHQIVLTAIQEVQDALVREAKQRDHLNALAIELEIAKKGMREAQHRYVNGLTNYLPVLTELTARQRLERQMVTMQAQLFKYRVALYRALGGNWMSKLGPSDRTQ